MMHTPMMIGRKQLRDRRKHHAQNLGRKLGTSHELQPPSRSTLRVSPEMG
jgi:hypothetical protein